MPRSDPTNLRGAALEYASSSHEKAFGPSQKAEIDALNALAYGLVYVGDQLAKPAPSTYKTVRVKAATLGAVCLEVVEDGGQYNLNVGDSLEVPGLTIT